MKEQAFLNYSHLAGSSEPNGLLTTWKLAWSHSPLKATQNRTQVRRLRAAFSSHTKGYMLSAAPGAEMFLIGTAYWMVVTQPN